MLASKQWANVAFIVFVGVAIDESEAESGPWGKGACPPDSDMESSMREANSHCKTARWDLIYGCASEATVQPRDSRADHGPPPPPS